MSINRLIGILLLGSIGCHDTGPDDIDIFVGEYLGTCYLYNKIFESGITSFEHDTIYDFPASVAIDKTEEGNFHITVDNNFLFYPYEFFVTQEESVAEPIRSNSNISVYSTDLTLIRKDNSMLIDHTENDLYGPGFHNCNCTFKKK